MAAGGKGGGGKGSSSSTGLSPFDIAAVEQWLGTATQAMSNRYKQLGLGVPSGDPIQAAASGQSLHNAGAGTAEQMDIAGLGNQAEALLGQTQFNNLNNPALNGQDTSLATLAGTLASQQAGNTSGVPNIGTGTNTG